MARLTPDDLPDTPPSAHPNQAEVDDQLGLIEQLLRTKDYEWARETLEGIAATIEETNRVTPKQKSAVEHVIVGRLKHDVGW